MSDDLFSRNGMGEYTEEFRNLPKELVGLDLEPEPLPPIDIEEDLCYEYIQINYRAHHARDMIELVGYNFQKKNQNTIMLKVLKERENAPLPEVWDNETDDYILIVFKKEERDEVERIFNLPGYEHLNTYSLDDLLNNCAFHF